MKTTLTISALVAAAVLFTGCSSKEAPKNSLIDNPSLLQQSKTDESVYSYLKEGADLSQYNSIVVPRIAIKGKSEDRLHESIEARISNYFTDTLTSRLNEVLKNNPGSGQLLLEVSVDSIQVGYEDLSAWQYLPITLAITAVGRGTGASDKDLNVAIALRLKDNNTQETLAMAIDSKKKEEVEKIGDVAFNDIKPMLDKWIDRIEKRFVELSAQK